VQFLVRDWQNFGQDWEDATTPEGQTSMYEALRKEMDDYLNKV
jgi:hypothetical protein